MSRAVLIALAASGALAAGAANAQQICCVSAPPPPPPPPPVAQPCCVGAPPPPAGLRGYAEPGYSPAPAYTAAQYGGGPYAGQYGSGPAYPPDYDPRPASSGLRGYVGIEYGKARIEPGAPAQRVETWTGEAAASGQLAGFGVQGDIKVASQNTLGSSDDGGMSYSPSLHVYQRNAYGLIGGWTGWSHTNGGDLFGIGGEGQAYFGNATLYGSGGYGHVSGSSGNPDAGLWTARLEGRYFITENLAIKVNGGIVWTNVNGVHTNVRSVGAGAEYQPDVVPFSIQASYTHSDASGSSAASDALRVGLRWNFNGGTLLQRDRAGPSLNNITDQFQTN